MSASTKIDNQPASSSGKPAKPPRILLASSSPYRQALLQRLGLAFRVAVPGVDESAREGETPSALVMRLAEAKARAVASGQADTLVIGSDQVAVLGGAILGKPGTAARAAAQLRAASGRRVEFFTGVCVYDTRRARARVDVVTYAVQFRKLDDADIAAYLARERPLDCAGSFKSEGLGVALFEHMEGPDPTALVGLPLIRLAAMLRECGVDVLRGGTAG